MFRRLLAVACMAGFWLVNPLPAAAADGFSCTSSPTTPGAWATLTCQIQVAKQLKSAEIVPPAGSAFCHHGDPSCGAPDGTVVGTMSITAAWVYLLCGVSTQTFNETWEAPDGAYTPPPGFTVVAQINAVNALATVKQYIIENSSGQYRIEVPTYPNLTCSGHTTSITIVLGTYNGVTYDIYRNPPVAGTYTWTCNLVFTDNTTESLSYTETIG